ncbi:hypothetical protein GCM10011402_17320 [Paracoccus acridae]|uniref:Uncharacterized protein n=1 Tax=Paracoccus acridae TaxID=1795310 RepID=A0ABQ1VH59_9RHOB|nr:hypothetical protein GCM10011402_17320 [Paracoccus acridae]
MTQAEGPDRQALGAWGAARRRKYLLWGAAAVRQCGALIVSGSGRSKGYNCANAKQKGPAVCTGMPGLRKAAVEEIELDGLHEALMTRGVCGAALQELYARTWPSRTKRRSAARQRATRALRPAPT